MKKNYKTCALEVAQEEQITGKEESQGSCAFKILQADHGEKGHGNDVEEEKLNLSISAVKKQIIQKKKKR